MASLPNYLAGNGDLGSWAPTDLFAGEKEIVTETPTGTCATAVTRYQVIALNTSGNFAPQDPDATDTVLQKAIGIALDDCAVGEKVPYYVSGYFNHAALTWDAAITTLAARRAVFTGTEIKIGSVIQG